MGVSGFYMIGFLAIRKERNNLNETLAFNGMGI